MDERPPAREKLQDFASRGSRRGQAGPVVTMYEFAPAPGVKVSKIAGLSDDLSMALKASRFASSRQSGRGVVGIEIPTATAETVYLKEIFAADEFQRSGAAAAGPWQGYLRPHRGRRPGAHAAPAGGRRHRHRQVGVDQRHDSVAALRADRATCA